MDGIGTVDDIIIETIQKNQTEHVRVMLREFKGAKFLDIRTYYEAGDGAGRYRPIPGALRASKAAFRLFCGPRALRHNIAAPGASSGCDWRRDEYDESDQG